MAERAVYRRYEMTKVSVKVGSDLKVWSIVGVHLIQSNHAHEVPLITIQVQLLACKDPFVRVICGDKLDTVNGACKIYSHRTSVGKTLKAPSSS